MRTSRLSALFFALTGFVITPFAWACTCEHHPLRVRPSDGRTGVPTTTRVFVAGFPVGTANVPASSVISVAGPVGEVATTNETTASSHAWTRILTPTVPLEPGVSYTVTVAGEVVSTFETGEVGDTTPPGGGASTGLTPEHSTLCERSSCGTFSLLRVGIEAASDAVDPATDLLYRVSVRPAEASSLGFVGVVTGGEDGLAFAAAGRVDHYDCRPALDIPDPVPGADYCVSVSVEDLSGNVTIAPLDEVCGALIDPMDPAKCAGPGTADPEPEVEPSDAPDVELSAEGPEPMAESAPACTSSPVADGDAWMPALLLLALCLLGHGRAILRHGLAPISPSIGRPPRRVLPVARVVWDGYRQGRSRPTLCVRGRRADSTG